MAYKYTGKELDDSTGLYFYEARYYDATLGRFISADTIVSDPTNPQAFNRYSYVFNNPLRYTDPTGHCPYCGPGGYDILINVFGPDPGQGVPAELVIPEIIAGPFPPSPPSINPGGLYINGIYTLPTVTVTNFAIPPVSVLPPIGSPFLNPFDPGVGNNLPFITFDPSIVFDSQGHAVATAAQEALQPVLSPADLLNVGKAGFSIGAGIIGGGLKIVGKQALISNQFKVLDRANKKLKEIAPKFGKNPDELLQKILSKGKLFKDLRTKNQGNNSVILERPDGRGFLRATFDPDGKTLKSVALNRPDQIPNLIQKGDIVPLE